jgi:cephalosporin hydroxylase
MGYKRKVEFKLPKILEGHFNVEYNNISTLKNPFDYVIYQMMIARIRPEMIVEIGTNQGGSALYFADLLQNFKIDGIVHTIDIEDKCPELVKNDTRIVRHLDGWQGFDLSILEQVKKPILVIDDGSHQYKDVIGALEQISPHLPIDSYFIVEDGIIDKIGWKKRFEGGPQRAIKEFLKADDSYTIDRYWCDFFGTNTTFNTNGYLKKVQ